MLRGRPLVGRLVVLNEHILEVIPRVDDIWLEASEPIHCGGLEHNWQVICHDVGVAAAGFHGDGITPSVIMTSSTMACGAVDPIARGATPPAVG